MADFDAKLKKLQSLLSAEEECCTELGKIQDDISGVRNNLTFQLDVSATIKSQLGRIHTHVGTQKKNIRQLRRGLDDAIKQYDRSETNICNHGKTGKKTIGNAAWAAKIDASVSADKANDRSNKYIKKWKKAALDALGKAGTLGKIAGLPIAIVKLMIDGDTITPKDLGTLLKGMGNSVIGLCENDESIKTFKELAGLNNYTAIIKNNAKATWWESLKKELSPITKVEASGKVSLKSSKIAGWALALVANGCKNYEEYKTDGISRQRAVAETISETLIDVGKMAALTAGIAAGAAAIGVSAPAVVVGGAAVAVSTIADIACENLTGKDVTEFVSDKVLDFAIEAGKKMTGAAKTVKKAASGWWKRITNANLVSVRAATA